MPQGSHNQLLQNLEFIVSRLHDFQPLLTQSSNFFKFWRNFELATYYLDAQLAVDINEGLNGLCFKANNTAPTELKVIPTV